MSEIKILSVHQPWAWGIIHAKPSPKDVENRTWQTYYRGTIYIHAAASKSSLRYLPFVKARCMNVPSAFMFGEIIGRVQLIDCIRNSRSRWAEDGWHWILEDPEAIADSIKTKGALSLWQPTEEIKEKIIKSEFFRPDAKDLQASILCREQAQNKSGPCEKQLTLFH